MSGEKGVAPWGRRLPDPLNRREEKTEVDEKRNFFFPFYFVELLRPVVTITLFAQLANVPT